MERTSAQQVETARHAAIGGCLAALLVLLPTAGRAADAAAPVVWVSPDGVDTASGRSPDPAGAADGPKASLQAALATLAAGSRGGVVRLRGGHWYLTEPVVIGAGLDGVTIEPAPGETPVLHGGLDLSTASWRDEGGGVFSTAPALPEGLVVRSLVGDDTLLPEARHPDPVPGDPRSGWLFAAAGTTGHESMRVRPRDIPPVATLDGLRVLVLDAPQWTSNLVGVRSIDAARGVIRFADNVPWHVVGPGSRYYLTGAEAFLDRPGEWRWDAATGRLRVKLAPGETPARWQRLVAGVLDSLIRVEAAAGVTIRGLVLADGTPHGSDRASNIEGGAIRLSGARDAVIEGNRIARVGVGINVQDVTTVTIRGNRIEQTAGNGVYVGMSWGGRPTRGVTVEGNTIRDTGWLFVESAGVFVGGGQGTRVVGNDIERAAQFGVLGAQIRESGEDAIRDVVVERNRIATVNTGSADGGAIKFYARLAGASSGHVVRGNRISGVTHLMNRPDGTFFATDDWSARQWPQPVGAGVYLDWNQSDVLIERNHVDASYGGILIVNSSGNVIRENCIEGGFAAAIDFVDLPREDAQPGMGGNSVEGNVVRRDTRTSAAVRIYDHDGGAPAARFAGNAYAGEALGRGAFRVVGGRRGGDLDTDLAGWIAAQGPAAGEHAATAAELARCASGA